MIEKNSNIETHTVGLRPAAAFLGARFFDPDDSRRALRPANGKGDLPFRPQFAAGIV